MDPYNWRWRINNLYQIITKQGKLQTFKENFIQKIINDSKKRRKMILKARQFGCTTGEIVKMLDFACFNENMNVCIMADRQENLEKIFSKVRLAHKGMPEDFKPTLAKGGGSKYELEFPNLNSKIFCTLENRGSSIQWLHISEAAFANPERIRATLETVPLTGIVTFESTPNGMGNDFHKRWVTPSIKYEKMFFPWFIFPEYRLKGTKIKQLTDEEKKFIRDAKKNYGVTIDEEQIAFRRAKQEDQKEMFVQEYPEDDISCFLASGGAVFDLVKVHDMLKEAPEPIFDDGEMKIFKEYVDGHSYVIGCDTAEGVGGDYSVATVMNAVTMEEVGQIRSNKWRPSEFAERIKELAQKFYMGGREWPLVSVERNNHGHAVLLELEEHLHYANLYHRKIGDRRDERPGWVTDRVTRPLMIDAFIDAVENSTVKFNSTETLGECLTLVDNGGKAEAADGENDDCVISAALALQMALEIGPAAQNNLTLTQMVRM